MLSDTAYLNGLETFILKNVSDDVRDAYANLFDAQTQEDYEAAYEWVLKVIPNTVQSTSLNEYMASREYREKVAQGSFMPDVVP